MNGASRSRVSTRHALLVTSCAGHRRHPRNGVARRIRNPCSHLCIRAGPDARDVVSAILLPSPGGPRKLSLVDSFPGPAAQSVRRMPPLCALARKLEVLVLRARLPGRNVAPVSNSSGTSGDCSPVRRGIQARPQCPGSLSGSPHPRIFTRAELSFRGSVSQAPLGHGAPACIVRCGCAVVYKVRTMFCHRMTSESDLHELAVQGLVPTVSVNLTCAPRRTSVTS